LTNTPDGSVVGGTSAPIEKRTDEERVQEAADALLSAPDMSPEALEEFFEQVLNKSVAGEDAPDDKEVDEVDSSGSEVGGSK
jgi:hypothetical protein